MNLNLLQTLNDFRQKAKKKLPKMVFGYIDGGAGDGLAVDRNRESFKRILLQPRSLENVSQRNQTKNLLGKQWQHVFGIAPMGLCNVANPKADMMLAHSANKYNIPLCVSTAASTTMEKMYEIAGDNIWFQLYMGNSKEGTFKLVKRANELGIKNLILSVDVPAPGYRPSEIRTGFKAPFKFGLQQILDCASHPSWSIPYLFSGMPDFAHNYGLSGNGTPFFDRYSGTRLIADLDFLKSLRDQWKGNLFVKGITFVEDAHESINCGCNGIYVSNHGGRQLESVPAALDLLKLIREELSPQIPILFDSGLRSGEDIIKALALGADFVFLGRPFLFASALGSRQAIIHLIEILNKQIDSVMAQLGCTSLENLSNTVIYGVDRSKKMVG
ncbi:MAG: alpha-hydroxy acid oxidase [Pseudomonadota bacterium]|nr:alpha-hydroxy acid oxidase [Pseudomonadota bacterium]